MILVLGSFSLFFVLFLLILSFHLFLWEYFLSLGGGLRVWVSSFECGFFSHLSVDNYFSFTYYVLLVFFVIFDLEVSLLLNLPFQGIFYKNLLSYFFFLSLMCFGFWVEVSKGYVSWSY